MSAVRRETPNQSEVLRFLVHADERAASLYPVESRYGLALQALLSAEVRFFVARDAVVRALGYGGYVLLPEHAAEVTHLLVDPAARGQPRGALGWETGQVGR